MGYAWMGCLRRAVRHAFAMVDGEGLQQTVLKKYASTIATTTVCAKMGHVFVAVLGRENFVKRRRAIRGVRMVLATRASVNVRRIGGETHVIAGHVSMVGGQTTHLPSMQHFRVANVILDGAGPRAISPNTAYQARAQTVDTALATRIAFARMDSLVRTASRLSAQTSAVVTVCVMQLSLGVTVLQGLTGLCAK